VMSSRSTVGAPNRSADSPNGCCSAWNAVQIFPLTSLVFASMATRKAQAPLVTARIPIPSVWASSVMGGETVNGRLDPDSPAGATSVIARPERGPVVPMTPFIPWDGVVNFEKQSNPQPAAIASRITVAAAVSPA